MYEEKKVKIVVVGDGAVGKTSMIASYATNSFEDDHVPTVYDLYNCRVEVNGEKIEVQIHDTAGQDDYDRTRPIAYPGTTCFILVFGVDSRTAFDHIEWKWHPEVQHFSKYTHFILAGNKIDRRRELSPQEVITPEMGNQLAEKIKADAYLECSAKTREGIKPIFDRAIGLSLSGEKKVKRSKCFLL